MKEGFPMHQPRSFKLLKRLLAVFLAALLLCGGLALGVSAADEDITAAFTDANFKAFVLQKFDSNRDGAIQKSEVENVAHVDVPNKNIASLAGIEHFTALTRLWCSYNQLTALDVSRNTALDWLECNNNQLTELDVSQNTKLGWFICHLNRLPSEDSVPGLAEVRARGGSVSFSPQRQNDPDGDGIENFELYGKVTKHSKTPLNWFLLIVCFGWIWMAF
jgi:Leucine-rich repeat (LRR) protein